jgi:hypothetical protein
MWGYYAYKIIKVAIINFIFWKYQYTAITFAASSLKTYQERQRDMAR